MDAQPQPVNVERLKVQLQQQLDQFIEKVAASVNAAAPGRFLADSEELVRSAIHDFGEAAYQAAIQQRVTAADAAFSPSTGPQDQQALQEPRTAVVYRGDREW